MSAQELIPRGIYEWFEWRCTCGAGESEFRSFDDAEQAFEDHTCEPPKRVCSIITRRSSRAPAWWVTGLLCIALLVLPLLGVAHASTPRRALAFGGPDGFTGAEVAHTIRAAAHRWPVPGGADFALAVAHCESGSDLQDDYAGDGYAGPFQQSVRYWQGRRSSYNHVVGPAYRVHRAGARRPRANVLVSIRQAHLYGWGAWSCA